MIERNRLCMAILQIKPVKFKWSKPVLLALTRTSLCRCGDTCQEATRNTIDGNVSATAYVTGCSSPHRCGVLDEVSGLTDAVAPLDRGCGGGEPGVQPVVAE